MPAYLDIIFVAGYSCSIVVLQETGFFLGYNDKSKLSTLQCLSGIKEPYVFLLFFLLGSLENSLV